MPRIPYAAQRLIADAKAHRPKTKVEGKPVGDLDGLNVYRTISFTKAVAKWLHPLLEAIDDPRVVGLDTTPEGSLLVTFSPHPSADSRSPFPLAEAETVVGGD